MSKKKATKYEGKIQELPDNKIFINVNNLKVGEYELNIVHKKKLIGKATFKKE